MLETITCGYRWMNSEPTVAAIVTAVQTNAQPVVLGVASAGGEDHRDDRERLDRVGHRRADFDARVQITNPITSATATHPSGRGERPRAIADPCRCRSPGT